MSLLEDVFLEDEAGEAERLERVIEGDEYDDVQNVNAENSDENSEREDEAQEDKRRVDPTKPKRVVKNPRFILNPARLTGPRGIQVITDHYKDFKFKGKGYEKEDLDMILKRLEHWAYRLYPKFEFSDCLKKIETLGKKRPVMVHLHKIRTDQYISEDVVEQKDSSGDEDTQEPEEDEFDKLLQQQIELARATPVPISVKKPAYTTPIPDRSLSMPKATSSPSINDEQRERMLRNRRLAEERRLSKLNKTQEPIINNVESKNDNAPDPISPEIQMTQVTSSIKEVSRFNVNESPDTSDSESEMVSIDESVVVEIHEKIVHDDNGVNSKIDKIDNNAGENPNGSHENDDTMKQAIDPKGTVDNQNTKNSNESTDQNSDSEDIIMTENVDKSTIIDNEEESIYLNTEKANTNFDDKDLIPECTKTIDVITHDLETDAILSNNDMNIVNVASNLHNDNIADKELEKHEKTEINMNEDVFHQSKVNINQNHVDQVNCDTLDVDSKAVGNKERALIEEEIMDLDFNEDF